MHDPVTVLKLYGIKFAQNGEWLGVTCPFHNDTSGGLKSSVHSTNGGFHCFSCGDSADTSLYGFLTATLPSHPSIQAIKVHLDSVIKAQKVEIRIDEVEAYHLAIFLHPEIMVMLETLKGINAEMVSKYKIGYNENNNRVTIPVFSGPNLIGVRQYQPIKPTDGRPHLKYINVKNFKPAIYLLENLNGTDVFITEGELKAIVLSHAGFPACSGTHGAETWKDEWDELFRGKNVIIVYDVDEPGRNGASIIARRLRGVAATIRDVLLPGLEKYKGGDITNYFVQEKHTAEDFRKLCIVTPEWTPPTHVKMKLQEDDNLYAIPLSETGLSDYNERRVETHVLVSAKDNAPFIIPKTVTVVCEGKEAYCPRCHVKDNLGYQFEIKRDDPLILRMVGQSDEGVNSALFEASGIYENCKKAKFRRDASMNMEDIRVVPPVGAGNLAMRRAWYTGHGIQITSNYKIKAKVTVDPKDQHATMIIYDAEASQDNISLFELKHDLSIFQPTAWTPEACEFKLAQIYNDLAINVTKVYGRPDVHLFFDLCWHSILWANFQGKKVKTWADMLIIGDSGQAKSEMTKQLMAHYQAGDKTDVKSVSVAGLIGGLEESNGRFFLKWGLCPLNDRRALVLDEVKGIPAASLSAMTDMRSSGIAEVGKIEKGKADARTRLLWLTNPRSDKAIAEYTYGVLTIKELMGSLEDVRRFDAAICVAKGTVDISLINNVNKDTVPHFLTSELCHHCVIWAWSRTEDQVVINPEAEQAVIDVATELSDTYSSAIPLVSPSDQRFKVLRLALALAARLYSVDEDPNVLVLRVCHVQVVRNYLMRIYNDPAMGYDRFSAVQQGEEHMTPAQLKQSEWEMRNTANAGSMVSMLLEIDNIQVQDVQDHTDLNRDEAGAFIGILVKNNALRRRGKGYRKTPAFISILRRLNESNLSNQTLHSKICEGAL